MNNDTQADAMQLKPCPNPWCESHTINGGEPSSNDVWEMDGTTITRYAVHCPYCTMQGPCGNTEADAIAAWNTRTASLAAAVIRSMCRPKKD